MNNNKKSLIGLIVFLGAPFLLKFLHIENILLREVGMWLLLLFFIILWIYFVEKRTIASIGWKKVTVKTIFGGIGLGLVAFILFGISNVVIQTIGLELNQEVGELFASQTFIVLLLISLRAAVVEEVLYRGYAFERINELTKSKWIAALVPVIIFMLMHLSWGVGHLVFVFFAGGLFMLVYISKRNLGLVMIAHFVTDVIAMLVLPMMLEA
ncbi:CPBP family intramembrane metalloprotease [bacterium]|nr:CPBP family intramembrane metalloprotease [bacterium]